MRTKKIDRLINEFNKVNNHRRALYAKRALCKHKKYAWCKETHKKVKLHDKVWKVEDELALAQARIDRKEASRALCEYLDKLGFCVVWNSSGGIRDILLTQNRKRDLAYAREYRKRRLVKANAQSVLCKLDLTAI